MALRDEDTTVGLLCNTLTIDRFCTYRLRCLFAILIKSNSLHYTELVAFITGQKMENRPQLKEALEDPGNGNTSAQVPRETRRPQYPLADTTKKTKSTNQSLRPTPPITLVQVTLRAWCLRKANLLRRRRKESNRRLRQSGIAAGQRHLPAG